MIRIVLENLLLFLLPTLVYAGYVYFVRRDATSGSGVLDEAPLLVLFAAGGLLVLAGLVWFGSGSGGVPGQHYTPAVLRDGHIEPGQIK